MPWRIDPRTYPYENLDTEALKKLLADIEKTMSQPTLDSKDLLGYSWLKKRVKTLISNREQLEKP